MATQKIPNDDRGWIMREGCWPRSSLPEPMPQRHCSQDSFPGCLGRFGKVDAESVAHTNLSLCCCNRMKVPTTDQLLLFIV